MHSDSLRSRPPTVMVALWMLGMKRVLVLRLEWLTLLSGVARLATELALCHFSSLVARAILL